MIREREGLALPGGLMFLVVLAALGSDIWLFQTSAAAKSPIGMIGATLLTLGIVVAARGFFIVNPNEAKVLQLFGRYAGTVKEAGLRWSNPLYTKKVVSLRAVSFESSKLKVNDLDGNPIEIAAIIVWRVVDSAKAAFDVDNYGRYVQVQSEAALRNMATSYAYDAHDDKQMSLRGHTAAIAEHLKHEVHEKTTMAGVEIVEARISHLAYAAEIAQAMLQRQQAGAIIAARQRIVDGAVGMVEMALDRLSRNNVVVLDEERKAQMVSNLLVVLCGERATQPIINTGTIYQ